MSHKWLHAIEICDARDVCLRGSEPGRQGRLVIPAPLRRTLELEEGDRLVARQEANRLVLEKLDRIKRRLKSRFARVPVERGLVDELIGGRREQFSIEDGRRESV